MTSEQIRIDAQLLTGLQINAITARTWVFDAVKFIAREYPLSCAKKTVITTTENREETYQITDELVRLEKITKGDKLRPLTEHDYECDETGNIMFYAPGEYHITYRYAPNLSQLSETSPIPMTDRFVEPVKYYVAARIRGRIFGQGDTDAQNYDSLFQSYIADANKTMASTNKRHRRMPPRY